MSHENVEVVRRAIVEFEEAGNAGASALYAADVVIDLTRALGPYRGMYEGGEAAASVWSEFHQQWDSLDYEVAEFIESGDHVVTPFTQRFRGREGIEVQATGTWLWTLRDGLITGLTLYQDRDEALAAAGLETQ